MVKTSGLVGGLAGIVLGLGLGDAAGLGSQVSYAQETKAEAEPKTAIEWEKVGHTYFSQAKISESISDMEKKCLLAFDAFKKASELAPKKAYMHQNMGSCYKMLGEAMLSNKDREGNPITTDDELGKEYLTKSIPEFTTVIEMCEKDKRSVEKKKQDFAFAYASRGLVYLRLGQIENGRSDILNSLKYMEDAELRTLLASYK